MKYKIEVMVMGEVIQTFEMDDKKEAKRIYMRTADNFNFYTQVYIDGVPITMTKANKVFKLTPKEAHDAHGLRSIAITQADR